MAVPNDDFPEASNLGSDSPKSGIKTERALQRGPQWLTGRFSHLTAAHEFNVYVPSSYHGAATSLIVMLHGAGQDTDDFAVGTEMNLAAESGGHIVVYTEQERVPICSDAGTGSGRQIGSAIPAMPLSSQPLRAR
jgi:hypothetical protein